MKVSDEATKRYLAEFEDYVNKLIAASCERKLHNSHGALLGLTRGISDYDELCAMMSYGSVYGMQIAIIL